MKGKKKPWFKVRKLKRKFKIQFNFLFFFIKLIEKKKKKPSLICMLALNMTNSMIDSNQPTVPNNPRLIHRIYYNADISELNMYSICIYEQYQYIRLTLSGGPGRFLFFLTGWCGCLEIHPLLLVAAEGPDEFEPWK
jgi:hypothetical protein